MINVVRKFTYSNILFLTIFICNSVHAVTPRTVLIEGIGGSLSANQLIPAIIAEDVLHNPHYPVYFYGTELCKDGLTEHGTKSIALLTAQGMRFIDKSNLQNLNTYKNLTPDYVFLATPPNTHIPLVKMWLSRKYPPKKILVENPFTENIAELKEFIEYLNKHPELRDRVRAFDLADISFGLNGTQLEQIISYLGSVDEIVMYWLKDNSGAVNDDPRLLSHDDRPISRENRVALLQEGMLFDKLMHLFPAIHNIVDWHHVKLTDIKAAQYDNAEIRNDTFVAARMLIKNIQTNKEIPVTMYAGTGIGEIRNLKINRNSKHLILLHNKSGKRVMLNIDHSVGHFLDKEGKPVKEFPLPRKYHAVIENLFLRDPSMGEPPESVLLYLEIVMDIRSKIKSYLRYNNYPKYRVGTRSKAAPSLEEVLLGMPRVYGPERDRLRNVNIEFTG